MEEGGGATTMTVIQRFGKLRMGEWLGTLVTATVLHRVLNHALRSNRRRMEPANIYLLKVNIINTRAKCERCSKSTIKTPEYFTPCYSVYIVNFENVIANWGTL